MTLELELVVALRRAAASFAAIVLQSDLSTPVPGSSWTTEQTASHVLSVIPRFSRFPRGEQRTADSPASLPFLNEDELEPGRFMTAKDLAAEVMSRVDDVIADVHAFGDDPPVFPFHGGSVVSADGALGILLGELVVHGWDIAHAVGARWPIDPSDVVLIWDGVEPILPGWIHPDRAAGHRASYELRLDRATVRYVAFQEGGLDTDARRHVDCHIAGRAGSILLVLYRRRSPVHELAAGRVVAWGRRPWLAFSLANRFYLP